MTTHNPSPPTTPAPVTLPTRHLAPSFVALVRSLKAGDRVKITQRVRVGSRVWHTAAEGVYRGINYLSTGVTTDRVAEDDIVVPTMHLARDSGELVSVALDEHTQLEKLS